MTTPRLSRDQVMINMAEIVAERSTCSRLHVGAVIARDHRAVSTGYNGAVSGLAHCEHTPYTQNEGGCDVAVHAEANAIVFAARAGVATEGAELFVTHQPCLSCAKLIINAGIVRVVFDHPYRLPDGLNLLNAAGLLTMRLAAGSWL